MKIASWDLERARTPTRRRGFDPGLSWSRASAPGRDRIENLDTVEDLWVAIRSHHPLEPLEAADAARAAAARLYPKGGPDAPAPDKRLSDHFGVAVELISPGLSEAPRLVR